VVFVECGGVTVVCVDQQLNNSLEELNLASNALTDEFTADDNFIHLGKLKKLDLRGNDLVYFPLDDRMLRAFENTLIELWGNVPLRSPPQSVIWSPEDLKAYLDDLRAESSPVVHIQVMVVGNGGVGKTTWCRAALLGKKPFFYGMLFMIMMVVVIWCHLIVVMMMMLCEDISQWDHEMVVEFLRARNVFGRRRAEELVGSVELKEMKGIMRIEGEEQAVIVDEQWLSRVSAGNRRVSKLIERECQQLLAMRREGADC